MKKVLVTGAAGRIGSRLIDDLNGEYEIIAADKDCSDIKERENERCHLETFDLTKPEDCLRLCKGVDTVIHLAANPSPEADYADVKHINIDGTYNMMDAAAEQGCRRLVFASSIHVVKGYPQDEQVKTSSPVRPPDLYGVSKAFGEALGSYYAYEKGLEVIAVRIGGYRSIEVKHKQDESPDMRERSTYLSEKDLNQLIRKCIETDLASPFKIVHGVSNNTFKFLDLSDTRQTTGYSPENNGFDFE